MTCQFSTHKWPHSALACRYDKLPGRVAQLLEKRRQQGGSAAADAAAEGADAPTLQPVAA